MPDPAAPRRGPHPLPLFLALAARVTGGDGVRLQALLEGLKRYQTAPLAAAMPEFRTIWRIGGVRLRYVGGPDAAPPVVVIPSLINAPVVLDLAPGRSLVRFLADQGHHVLLLDWGEMQQGERRLGLAGLVTTRLMPLLAGLSRPVRLVGYCLGGTLALAAAHLLGPRLGGLAMIASPWHFDGFSSQARATAAATWSAIRPVGEAIGAVPVSLLNPLFWALDEAAVVTKFERLARSSAGDPDIGWFAAVEDWANSGAPLSRPAARDLFEIGFAQDRIGRGLWNVGGTPIRPESIAAPILDIGATQDRIVPAGARIRRADVRRIDVAAGHVGMVVGSQAREKLWEPLSNWARDA